MSYLSKRPSASSRSSSKTRVSDVKPSWTFLTNHSHVLILLAAQAELPLREVAARVGITERAVQRIVTDLEEARVLKRTKVGRQNRYTLELTVRLRHPIEAHRSVGDLVAMINTR